VWTLILVSAACWLCALIATPRESLTDNEVAELVYVRLLGRQQRLVLFALALTILTLIWAVARMPGRIDADLAAARATQNACPAAAATTAATPCASGVWGRGMPTVAVPTVNGPPAVNQ
jgi:hypothetical protein